MTDEQLYILEKAVQKFGTANQLDMVVEECAELIQAINKLKRSGLINYVITKPNKGMSIKDVNVYNNLCSEVADVKIMIAQLEFMLNPETIQISLERKIERLQKRINDEK